MKRSFTLVVASVASLLVADVAMAQPRSYREAWGHSDNHQQTNKHDRDRGRDHGRDRHANSRSGNHYYNGRWVDDNEWRRYGHEQNRWANNYRRRHRTNRNDNSSALLSGIIGFALGAAIVGSQQQVEHARVADQSWDDYCDKKYRSYDRSSRTYMGYDGVRHYCQ